MSDVTPSTVCVILDGTVVDALETKRPTSFVVSWTRLDGDANPLLRVPAPARAAVAGLAGWAEALKDVAYARVAPVARLSWAQARPPTLAEHLGGRPRVQLAISHTDAEFWTPRLLGRRLLFPTAAQCMRGGNLTGSSCLSLQFGSPPRRTTELPRAGLVGLLRSPEGEHHIVANATDGYFVVSLTLAASVSTASVSMTSTTGGKPEHRRSRLAAPAWFELVIRLDARAPTLPPNSALQQTAEDGRC